MSEGSPKPVVAFVGGGTGGHLSPGLAVARWLRRRHAALDIVFFTTGRPVERTLLGGGEFPTVDLPARRSPSRWWGWPATVASQVGTVIRSLGELRRQGVSVLVALGGYGAVGPGLAAWLLGRPLLVLEQNGIPGKATRFLSLLADVVCVSWPESIEGLWRRRFAVETGNPLRTEVLTADVDAVRAETGIDAGSPVLLVLGGSQGARAVNRWVTEAMPRLARELPDLQVIHQAGQLDYDWVADSYRGLPLRSCVRPFFTDMGGLYAVATVTVARAGATTLSELAATGVPAILVPYPHAADDHQRVNARLASSAGGVIVVEESEFGRTDLVELLRNLLTDRSALSDMARAIKTMARPDATRLVGQCVESLLLHPEARFAALVAGNGR